MQRARRAVLHDQLREVVTPNVRLRGANIESNPVLHDKVVVPALDLEKPRRAAIWIVGVGPNPKLGPLQLSVNLGVEGREIAVIPVETANQVLVLRLLSYEWIQLYEVPEIRLDLHTLGRWEEVLELETREVEFRGGGHGIGRVLWCSGSVPEA